MEHGIRGCIPWYVCPCLCAPNGRTLLSSWTCSLTLQEICTMQRDREFTNFIEWLKIQEQDWWYRCHSLSISSFFFSCLQAYNLIFVAFQVEHNFWKLSNEHIIESDQLFSSLVPFIQFHTELLLRDNTVLVDISSVPLLAWCTGSNQILKQNCGCMTFNAPRPHAFQPCVSAPSLPNQDHSWHWEYWVALGVPRAGFFFTSCFSAMVLAGPST